MKKLITIIAVVLLLTGCTKKNELEKFSAKSTEVGFDTVLEFIAFAPNQKKFDEYFDMVKKDYIHYNELFDKYNDYEGVNNIKTINDNAGIEAVEVDPLIIEMLVQARDYTEISKGYFDVTYGAVLEIWHDYREEGELLNAEGKPGNVPSREMLEEANQYTGWEFVEIDTVKNTVYLTHERTKLDVGAIAKGYATELAAQNLEKAGVEHAIVSGGGNIRTINGKPDGSAWAIGIEEPSLVTKGESVDILNLQGSMSVVTSGDYQRYYLGPNDQTISHLINPFTLDSRSDFRSVTIVTPDSTMADALSTAAYMMSYEEALEFVDNFNTKYPDKKIDIFWIADNRDDWTEYKEFQFNMTDNLKQFSKSYNEKKD